MTTTTRTQHRAICPACFAQQAVNRYGRLAAHGYTRPQQWNSNVGTCTGAGERHFGMPEGRAYTAKLVTRLRESAVSFEQQAQDVAKGTAPVWGRVRVSVGVSREAVIDLPTSQQRLDYAAQLRRSAAGNRAVADEFEAKVAAWVAAEPIAVQVEKSSGPLLHWRGGSYRGKACASSAMGAMKGYTTSDRTKVTCEKCKATRYWALADDAAKGGR